MLPWLLGAGVGPALVALPVNWTADALSKVASQWFRRLRRNDDLSRMVLAATGSSAGLTRAEFDALRSLLEDQQTWSVARRATVQDLVTRIGSCLPLRDGRTAEDSEVAALTIARGLLEFAAASLDPKLFQQVLLARLQRTEMDQASVLDKALLGLHADLVDRLPQGPAQQAEIVAYLRALIDWINSDPWPRDPRFGGPVLIPAAFERALRVTITGPGGGKDLDADTLARRCRRLVLLGGPGSGKTWLARRTVRRCAEEALVALGAGTPVDEIELPLYTTCAQLFTAGGDIRQAVVSSALDQLPDLGDYRLAAALRLFFTERTAPTLLVIDSLHEAHGSSERLRQADTLPWRIVLTSRPNSWNHQLSLEQGEDSQRVAVLQPLRYPEDVEPFIHCWFKERPEWGEDLAAKIARRSDLQQAVTVPLLLAFYCIIGSDDRLPEFRRDLYARVIRRMLTGRWSASADYVPDMAACLETLRAWAWSAATIHPVSGVGAWMDDIPTRNARLGRDEQEGLDNIASPLGPPDIDTGVILRRFIDRSIREHLVAEHVASLPVDQSAESLLPHLWHDPDWEYAAPAAITMHPHRDQLLKDLICRAAGSVQIPGDFSIIDGGWEFRRLLARIAAESGEADWSPEMAAVISRARAELARSGRTGDLGVAAFWGTSNRVAREALLRLLTDETRGRVAEGLAIGVARLNPTTDDLRQARDVLLGLLGRQTDGWEVERLTRGVAQLALTPEDKDQARGVLLGLLIHQTDCQVARELARGVAQLDPTAEDKGQAIGMLLGLLRRQTDGHVAKELAAGVAKAAATAKDTGQALGVLLGLLAHETDAQIATELTAGVAQLASTTEDKGQARGVLLGLLVGTTSGPAALWLASGVAQLDPTSKDKGQARSSLLGLLTRETDSRVAKDLADKVAQLDPTPEEARRARGVLLGLLDGEADCSLAAALADGVARLDPTAEELGRVHGVLLELLDRQADCSLAAALADGVARLDPTAEEAQRARGVLLGLLDAETDGWEAVRLAGGVAQLDPTAEEVGWARDVLLGLLDGETDGWEAVRLAGGVAQLDPTAEEARRARGALLGLLDSETDGWEAATLARGVIQLDPTVIDLSKWHAWAAPPTGELLAAVRRNSALAEWLSVLPALSALSS